MVKIKIRYFNFNFKLVEFICVGQINIKKITYFLYLNKTRINSIKSNKLFCIIKKILESL